jgi:hypothetical protein
MRRRLDIEVLSIALVFALLAVFATPRRAGALGAVPAMVIVGAIAAIPATVRAVWGPGDKEGRVAYLATNVMCVVAGTGLLWMLRVGVLAILAGL